MKRIGFTIILNGEKHLLHNNYAEYLLDECLDYWVVIEGASKPGGSTSWCIGDISKYHKDGHSIDATLDILESLKMSHLDKMFYGWNYGLWNSKDEMVNFGIKMLLDNGINSGWLWQIDIDEQWTKEDMEFNEQYMLYNSATHGDAKFYQYVGKDIYAEGPHWGGNTMTRLWNWTGEFFNSHEPPVLGKAGYTVVLPKKYHHYSYYHEEDVKFKSQFYNYGEDFFNRWEILQKQTEFPRPLGELFPGVVGEIKRM